MRLALPLLLLLSVFAAFRGSLAGEFVYDDRVAIQSNPLLRDLGNLPAAFDDAYWQQLRPEEERRLGHWRPLATTALALGYAVGDGTPFGFRLTSLLVHLAATLAAFALARRVGLAPVAATLAAAVYGLHPAQVEAVAWPSSIADPLLGLFGLLCAERYVAWRRGGGAPALGLALAAAACALLAKEVAIVLVALPIAVDRLLRPTRDGAGEGAAAPLRSMFPTALFGGVAAAWLVARMVVFGSPGAGLGRSNAVLELPFARALLLRVEVLGDLLATLALPFDLAVIRVIDPLRGWLDGELAVELAAILAAAGLAVLFARRGPRPALFGLALALLPLAPAVARIGSVGRFAFGERFLVLSTAGLGLLLAVAVERAPARALARGALGLWVAVLGYLSWQRVDVWHDDERLWSTAAEEAPNSPVPHLALGHELLRRFQSEPSSALANRALASFERALDIAEAARQGTARAMVSSHDVLQGNVGLGWCHLSAARYDGYGDYETPQRIFELLLEARPDSAEAWTGLGIALQAQEAYDRAIDAFEQALRIDPSFASTHYNLGQVQMRLGRWKLARERFERVLELRSGYLDDYLWAARASIEERRFSDAAAHLDAADRLFPADPQAPTLRAAIAIRRQDPGAALEHADEALRRDPEDPLAHSERAKALQLLGQEDEALLAFRRACDFGPELFEPHYNVAALLLARGASESALPYLRRAYTLCPDPALRSTLRGNLARALQSDREGLIELARVDAARRDLEPALYWAEGVLELDPDDVDGLRLAAELLLLSERPTEAAALLTRAQELAPDRFVIVKELGLALVAAERHDEARPWLLRALELLPQAIPGDDPPSTQTRAVLRDQLEGTLAAQPIGPAPPPDAGGDG